MENNTKNPKIIEYKLFINGTWKESQSKETRPNINPATEEITSKIAMATQEDIDEVVNAARKAFDEGPWPRMSGHERGRMLIKVAQAIEEHADELAYLETIDMGKPIAYSKSVDVPLLIELFYYYGGMASKIEGATRTSNSNTFNYVVREPLGVVAAITPFNFPLLLSGSKIAPALCAGNTVIHKPAFNTSLSALKVAEIFQEVGFPDGVFNVITGSGSTVGNSLVEHKGVDKIAFTGSTPVGQGIIEKSAKTLKKTTMELGGKSANIIFADANIEQAVESAFFGIFYNKGEICTAGSRLIVERSSYEKILQKLVEKIENFPKGNPLNPENLYGPLASENQLKKMTEYVEIGKQEGARLIVGGNRFSPKDSKGKGFYFEPTIFADCTMQMRIVQEEIFGPILTVMPFDTEEEAIMMANGTEYGLAAGIHTTHLTKAHRVAKAMEAGIVWVNTYNEFDVAVPFGGYKSSGFGREEGPEVLESYTHTKSVMVNMKE